MRTLLDNSTISGALRAIGQSPLSSKDLFNIDISALRTFIDHVLLSEKIYIPDNYQAEFSEERKSILAHPDIVFAKINSKLDEKAIKHAIAHVQNWGLGNNLAQGYRDIFREMNILFTHAWRKSEPFLVLSHFGVENKYNNSVMHQILDQEINQNHKDSFRVKGYNKETIKVAQKISWSAVRTVYNRELAKLYGAEYVPHPVRNVFNAQCILFDNDPHARNEKKSSSKLPRHSFSEMIDDTSRNNFISNFDVFFKNFWTDIKKEDENVFGVATVDVEMPPFLSYILNSLTRHSTPSEIIESIFQLRERPDVKDLRKKLFSIYFEIDDTQKQLALRGFALELKDLKNRVQKYLGYNHEKVSISLKVMSYQANVPRFLVRPLYPHKPRLAFIRDVILDLSNVSSLGRLHDTLWSMNARKK